MAEGFKWCSLSSLLREGHQPPIYEPSSIEGARPKRPPEKNFLSGAAICVLSTLRNALGCLFKSTFGSLLLNAERKVKEADPFEGFSIAQGRRLSWVSRRRNLAMPRPGDKWPDFDELEAQQPGAWTRGIWQISVIQDIKRSCVSFWEGHRRYVADSLNVHNSLHLQVSDHWPGSYKENGIGASRSGKSLNEAFAEM